MNTEVTRFDFHDAFRNMKRSENFSYKGLDELFDYFEMLEDEIGEKIELDVIAICCDYVEYDSFEELQADYNDIETEEDLYDNTSVVCFDDDCIIIQSY